MNTQIVLISVDYDNARKVCEQIENFVYPTLTALRETLYEKLDVHTTDENHPIILTISQFMDEVNDQLLDNLSEYFITYVKIG